MIKADIVNKVAETSEISRVKAAQAVDTVIEGLATRSRADSASSSAASAFFRSSSARKGSDATPKPASK